MITKKQLQERVRLTHQQIDWLFNPVTTTEQIRQEVEAKYPGVIVSGTREELTKALLKGLVSEHFHPGL